MERALVVGLLCVGGCLAPNVGGGLTSPSPRDMAVGDRAPKAPPEGGGATATDCSGVTDKGRCEISDKGQVAVVCDVGANKLERFDCSAMHKVCVIDSARGASCAALPPPATPPATDGGVPATTDMAHASADMAHAPNADMARPATPDMAQAAPMCPSGVDYRGYCASATGSGAPDTAIWCDSSTGQTYVVDCAALGKSCQVDACADGAYCCDAPVSVDMATAPSTSAECEALGYAGACEDGHARWCADGQIVDIDCGARGQGCAVDECASGAYCCDL